ncbi:alpha-amylase [Reinekea forsetii]|nr:alpha-amylase [Reinekea forsetii]
MIRSLLLIALLWPVLGFAENQLIIETVDGVLIAEEDLEQDQVTVALAKGNYQFYFRNSAPCAYSLGNVEGAKLRFNKPFQLQACAIQAVPLKVRVAGDIQFTLSTEDKTVSLKLLPKQTSQAYVRPLPEHQCPIWQGEPVTVDVSTQFKNGELVRDFYSKQTATVENGEVTFAPAKNSNGLLLIESANAEPSEFTWGNALVYFLMTDRFHNGDLTNDVSFDRRKDNKEEVGTFHGGDIKGVIEKLDYIEALGATAIWMTPVVEQIHGFVGGGKDGTFPFYAYHGYWALDYTKLDPNFGTDEDLRTLVKEAHKRDIRLVWDTVINHAGYPSLADLKDFNVDVLKPNQPNMGNDWQPKNGENWHSYTNLIDFQSGNWRKQWWSDEWIRSDMPGYTPRGYDDLSMALAGLPDYLTESKVPVELPPILKKKKDTRAQNITQPVIQHLIDWQTYWVREFGIDAFRSDTAKHVELEHWLTLKQEASNARRDWQGDNQDTKLSGETDFWMVGEVFGHPLFKDYYYDYGFDSLINFEYQDMAHNLALCMNDSEAVYQKYAQAINSDPDFNALTYISSHDTTLFYAKYQSLDLQKRIAAPFLLLPGGIQIYYGDETARPLGPYADDFHQGTRSDMNWSKLSEEHKTLLKHWQLIGQFRKKHAAVGMGAHQMISKSPYAFSRSTQNDRVIVVFAGNER